MKTFLIICFLISFGFTSKSVFSQDTEIIIKSDKIIPLEEVFDLLKEQTTHTFIYSIDLFDGMPKVSLKKGKTTVGQLLESSVSKLGYTIEYKKDGTILVFGSGVIPDNDIVEQDQLTVSGTVTDPNGIPLPGVTVQEQGTSNGVVTDFDGNFSIEVSSPESVLIFSYVGMKPVELIVGSETIINVQMKNDLNALDEIVLIGYGSQKRVDVTGAVSSISSEDFSDVPMTNIAEGLSGRIPGLNIISTSAGPGSEPQILLRGRRSFTASNDPLLIVDGSPFYGSLNDINPYDIESVDVLKDASSTAIYGARGANGVIIITTKRGVVGRPVFMLSSYAGVKTRYGRIPFALGKDYAEIAREAYRAFGTYPEERSLEADALIFDAIEMEAIKEGKNGLNYQELFFKTGKIQKHQISVRGGSESVKYNVSGNFFENKGIIPGDVYDRYSLRTNLDFTFSPSITAGSSILLTHSYHKKETNGALQQVFRSSPLGKLYQDDGSPRFTATADGLILNPLADYLYDSYRWDNKSWSVLLNSYAQVEILPGLKYRLNVGTNFNLNTIKESAGYYSLTRNKGAPIANIFNSVKTLNLYESILTYDKYFNEDHHLTLTAIHGLQSSREETSGVDVSDIPYELSRYHNIGSANFVTSVGSSLLETKLLSYAGRLFYGYKSKYLLTLSFRADGASQFSKNNKWGYFPSAAIAWTVSNENFMKSTQDWLSLLKFRLSYGISGNQAIEPYQTQGGLSRTAYNWGDQPAFGYRITELANPNLKWETTAVYNFGTDFRLFDGRIQGSFELYKTKTYDLLMFRKLPITTGYEQVLQNVGKTSNTGFEIQLSTANINNTNFKWNTDFSFSHNDTEIVELYNGTKDDIGNLWFIGEPIRVYYDFKKIGIWQLNEESLAASYGREPGQIKVLDVNDDGAITDDDRMVLGSPQPDFIGSIVNHFNYKNWDLSFQTFIRWGGITSIDAFAPFSKKRYNKLVFDYWTPSNPTNNYPRPNQLYEGAGLNGSTLTYRDASYISLRQLSLGYTIPLEENSFGFNNARIYVSGNNLAYWTKSELREFNMKANWRPPGETETGETVIGTYPALRTFIAGFSVSF